MASVSVSLCGDVKTAAVTPIQPCRRVKHPALVGQLDPGALPYDGHIGGVEALADQPTPIQSERSAGFDQRMAFRAQAQTVRDLVRVLTAGTSSASRPAVMCLLDSTHTADFAVAITAGLHQFAHRFRESRHRTTWASARRTPTTLRPTSIRVSITCRSRRRMDKSAAASFAANL